MDTMDWMSRKGLTFLLAAAVVSLSLSAWATVPERLRLQGLLEDANGDAVAGTADLTIQLYTTQEGGDPVFTETVSSVALEQGRFSLNVGDAPTLGTLSAVITANPELWLGLSINGGTELPRQRLESVPFALQAKDLECTGCIQKTDIQDGVFSSVAFSGAYDELINAPDTSTLLNGTGTANALPKYTAAGTLGDSSVTEAGGLVGIGTAPPTNWRLHVEGEGAATGHVAHFSTGGGVAYVGIGANQKSHYLYTKSNGNFGINVPGVGDKLTILNNGNVGIGTTTPTSILSIDGTTFNGAAAANNLLHLQGTTSASLRFQTAGGGGTSADLRAANGEGLYFEVDDVPRMYINTSGNVGIGTDGPTAKLDIRGNENIVQLNVRANSEQGDFVVFENSVGGNLFEFTGAGNLEVMKGMLILKNGKPVALKDNLGANRHVLLMDDKNRVNLDNPTGGPVLLNSSGGNVGIGTSLPGAKLEISGGDILLDNNRAVRFKDTEGTKRGLLQLDNGNNLFIGDQATFNSDIWFFAGAAYPDARMFIESSNGNVGIGTTTPLARFHARASDTGLTVGASTVGVFEMSGPDANIEILGGATSDQRIIFKASTGSAQIRYKHTDNDADYLQFHVGSSVNNTMRIEQSGNVGIGTTSPSAPLHVSSNTGVKFQSVTPGDSASDYDFTIFNLKRGVGATTNIHFDMRDSASATATYSKITSTIRDNTNGSEAGTMELSTLQSGTLTEVMRLGSSGDVGIGANGGTRGRLLVSDDTVSYNGINEGHGTLTLQITKVRTAGEGPHISFVVPKGAAGVVEDMAYIAAVASDSTVNSRKADLTFGTRNQSIGEKMRLTSDGKVGIGTTSPSEKLDVAGTVKATKFVGDGSSLTGISAGKWSDATGGIHYSGGNVGIVDSSPTSPGLNSRFLDIGDGTNTEATLILEENDSVWEFIADTNLRIAEGTYPNQKTYLTITNAGKVEVAGTVKATKFEGDGSSLTGISAGKWSDATGGIHYSGGKVGIGTSVPGLNTTANTTLDVHGPIRVSGDNFLTNVWMGGLESEPNLGQFTVNNADGDPRAAVFASSSGGGVLLGRGLNGKMNSALWYYGASPDHGLLELFDDTETARVSLNVHTNNAGQLRIYGPSGELNVGLWNQSGADNNGALHLYAGGDNNSATSRVALTTGDSDQNAGMLFLRGKNGNQNAYLGNYAATPDHGLLTLNDSLGTARVRLSVHEPENFGKLQLYGPNEKLNVWGGAYESQPDHGVLLLYDDEGDISVRLDAKDTDEGSLRLYGATANQQTIWMGTYSEKNTGNMVMYGENGENNVWLGGYNATPNEGAMSIYNGSGTQMIGMSLYQGAGTITTYGTNGKRNVYIGTWSGTTSENLGTVMVYNSTGHYKAGMYISANNGHGYLYSTVKNFRIDHPEKPDHEIWYASVEGPEAAAYVRGTAQLVDGKARVILPEHFRVMAAKEGITVTLTPMSAASKGLAVVTTLPGSFSVTELHAGRGSYDFHWEVKAVRIGFEDYQPVRQKGDMP